VDQLKRARPRGLAIMSGGRLSAGMCFPIKPLALLPPCLEILQLDTESSAEVATVCSWATDHKLLRDLSLLASPQAIVCSVAQTVAVADLLARLLVLHLDVRRKLNDDWLDDGSAWLTRLVDVVTPSHSALTSLTLRGVYHLDATDLRRIGRLRDLRMLAIENLDRRDPLAIVALGELHTLHSFTSFEWSLADHGVAALRSLAALERLLLVDPHGLVGLVAEADLDWSSLSDLKCLSSIVVVCPTKPSRKVRATVPDRLRAAFIWHDTGGVWDINHDRDAPVPPGVLPGHAGFSWHDWWKRVRLSTAA